MERCLNCEYAELMCTVEVDAEITTVNDWCALWNKKQYFLNGAEEEINSFIDYLIENASEAFEHKDRELLEKVIWRYIREDQKGVR